MAECSTCEGRTTEPNPDCELCRIHQSLDSRKASDKMITILEDMLAEAREYSLVLKTSQAPDDSFRVAKLADELSECIWCLINEILFAVEDLKAAPHDG